MCDQIAEQLEMHDKCKKTSLVACKDFPFGKHAQPSATRSVVGRLGSAWCPCIDVAAAVVTLSEARQNLRFLVCSPIKLIQHLIHP